MHLPNSVTRRLVSVQRQVAKVGRKGAKTLQHAIIPDAIILLPGQPDLDGADSNHTVIEWMVYFEKLWHKRRLIMVLCDYVHGNNILICLQIKMI